MIQTPFGAQAIAAVQHISDLEDSNLIDMVRLPQIESHWKDASDASDNWFALIRQIPELASVYYAHTEVNQREVEIDKAVFLREHPSWSHKLYRTLMELRISWELELRMVEDLIAEEGQPQELTDAQNQFKKAYGFIDPEITYLTIIRKYAFTYTFYTARPNAHYCLLTVSNVIQVPLRQNILSRNNHHFDFLNLCPCRMALTRTRFQIPSFPLSKLSLTRSF